MSQMGALKLYMNDIDGLREAMQYYFTHQFLDQVAASGEQPFEAVRTRPFHYRCFNLEAMIVRLNVLSFSCHVVHPFFTHAGYQ